MPFKPVQAERLAQSVAQQIELLILRGLLRPGERLPPERELAERLEVSRPSLRLAIADLQDRGLLVTRSGTGVYVAEVLGSAFSEGLVRLFASHREAMFDYVDFRRELEGMAAERAARQSSDTDLKVIATIFGRMEAAHAQCDPTDEAALDAEFHLAIVEAGHNIVMLHMMRAMFDLLKAGVFYNRQQIYRDGTNRVVLLEQHRAIHDAILARDAGAARRAAEAHMRFVEATLADMQRAERNEEIARMRYETELQRN